MGHRTLAVSPTVQNPSLYNMLPSDVANPDPQNVTGWLNDLVSGLEAFSDSQRRLVGRRGGAVKTRTLAESCYIT